MTISKSYFSLTIRINGAAVVDFELKEKVEGYQGLEGHEKARVELEASPGLCNQLICIVCYEEITPKRRL